MTNIASAIDRPYDTNRWRRRNLAFHVAFETLADNGHSPPAVLPQGSLGPPKDSGSLLGKYFVLQNQWFGLFRQVLQVASPFSSPGCPAGGAPARGRSRSRLGSPHRRGARRRWPGRSTARAPAACAASGVPSATITMPACCEKPMPTPPPWCSDTQVAPRAVLSSALSSGQSDTASEPSFIASVSRLGEATEPESR